MKSPRYEFPSSRLSHDSPDVSSLYSRYDTASRYIPVTYSNNPMNNPAIAHTCTYQYQVISKHPQLSNPFLIKNVDHYDNFHTVRPRLYVRLQFPLYTIKNRSSIYQVQSENNHSNRHQCKRSSKIIRYDLNIFKQQKTS